MQKKYIYFSKYGVIFFIIQAKWWMIIIDIMLIPLNGADFTKSVVLDLADFTKQLSP